MLTDASETFFRQENLGSSSFLIDFGGNNFSSTAGNYVQVYVPNDSGKPYIATSTIELDLYRDYDLEVTYNAEEGAKIYLDGEDVTRYIYGKAGNAIIDTNKEYLIGTNENESFYGEVNSLSLSYNGNTTNYIEEEIDTSDIKLEAKVKLTSASQTFFRQENLGSKSFLVEFGADNFSSKSGYYVQVYVPNDLGKAYIAISTIALEKDQLHTLKITYEEGIGAAIILDGQDVTEYKSGDAGKPVIGDIDTYVAGSNLNEIFVGDIKYLTLSSEAKELYNY